MRIKQAAKLLNISPSTLRNYTNQGKINSTPNPAGQRTYTQKDLDEFLIKNNQAPITPPEITAHYARSSKGDKNSITEQLNTLTTNYGEPNIIITDRGSGLNENRPGLNKLIKLAKQGKITHINFTYKDRLTRFGYTYLESLFKSYNVTISPLHESVKYSAEEELLHDFMSLIASFSGKFYQLRSRENQKALLTKVQKEWQK